jgi:hypothetical protein
MNRKKESMEGSRHRENSFNNSIFAQKEKAGGGR